MILVRILLGIFDGYRCAAQAIPAADSSTRSHYLVICCPGLIWSSFFSVGLLEPRTVAAELTKQCVTSITNICHEHQEMKHAKRTVYLRKDAAL